MLESTEKGRHYRCKHVFEKDDDGNPQKYCTTEISTGPTVNISNLYAHCRKGHWRQTSPTPPERDEKGEIVIPDPDDEEDEAGIVITKGDVRNYFGAIPKKKKSSRLSHMLFFLYRRNKTAFLAAQNYRNWQDTIKNMFMNVAVAQHHGIEDFYWFLNTNKYLEQLFEIIWSMIQGNMNFDCLDLRDRLGDAVMIQWIYSDHPEWDRPSRRINNTNDRKNCRSWRGDTKVANVNLTECWNKGRDWAILKLADLRAFANEDLDIGAIVINEPGVNMQRPYKIQIGVLSGDMASYNLVDLEDDDDDEESN